MNLLRRGVYPGAAREDLAAQEPVYALREDVVVVAEDCYDGDGEYRGGYDGRGPYESPPPATPESFGRLLEPHGARPALRAACGGRYHILRRATQGPLC